VSVDFKVSATTGPATGQLYIAASTTTGQFIPLVTREALSGDAGDTMSIEFIKGMPLGYIPATADIYASSMPNTLGHSNIYEGAGSAIVGFMNANTAAAGTTASGSPFLLGWPFGITVGFHYVDEFEVVNYAKALR
jgi:hypothetical protein